MNGSMNTTIIALAVLCIAFIALMLVWNGHIKKKNAAFRAEIESGMFISLDEFEKNWISDRYGNKGLAGYKYNDGPGCYVIMIYGSEPSNPGGDDYENIYIGQSVKVCQRVHNHFNGKGNGDVYADRKMGKHLYVHFEACSKEEMNALEKRLISVFGATRSYNKTRGGSAQR